MSKTIDAMGQEHGHNAREFTRGCKVCDDTYKKFGFRALETDPEQGDAAAAAAMEWFNPTPAALAGAQQAAQYVRDAIHAFSSILPPNVHDSFKSVVDNLRDLATQLDNAGRAGTQWPR